MHIPQTAEYALRAVVCLAGEPTAVRKTIEIARATQVPTSYLSKILQTLGHKQLLISTAGRKGGFRLSRPASQISVLDVVRAVAPSGRILKCPLGIAAHNGALCPLHRRLDEAMASIEATLAATPITDLLQGAGEGRVPLCEPIGVEEQPKAPAAEEAVRPQRSSRMGRRPKGGAHRAGD
jgi:Rrf2 family transcriptional regulator, nitric oxide-sensitive transcriptional repressor